MSDKKQKANLGGYIFGGLVAAVILGGGFLVYKEMSSTPGSEPINGGRVTTAKDPFAENSLMHVADELISYEKTEQFNTKFSKVWGIDISPEGNVYVAGDNGIRIFNKSGKELKFIETKETTRFVLVKDKQIYAVSTLKIDIYKQDGTLVNTWKDFGTNPSLTAIGFTEKFAFVCDRNNRVVWKTDLEGKVISKFGSMNDDKKNGLNIPGPYMDVDVSDDGIIFVSNPGRHNVNGYNEDGELKVVVGHPSFKHTGFNGCCNPVAIHCFGDDIITGEKGISRVKVLSRDDKVKTIIAAPKEYKRFKHSIIIDLGVDTDGNVYTLVQGFEDVFVFRKKSGDKG